MYFVKAIAELHGKILQNRNSLTIKELQNNAPFG